MTRKSRRKGYIKGPRGRPPLFGLEVVSLTTPSPDTGLREAVIRVTDKNGVESLWRVLTNEDATERGALRNVDQEVLNAHCEALRRRLKAIIRAATKQQTLGF